MRRKTVFDILFGVFLVYGLTLAFLYVAQRSMMYFPGGMHPLIQSMGIEEPIVLAPRLRLDEMTYRSWYWPAKDGFETIVFFHGNGQAYQYWMNKLKIFKEQGYGAVYVEYPGYGGLGGKPTEQGIYENAENTLGWLGQEHSLKPSQMIFYGESLGTGVAVEMATRYPDIKAMILESAYSSTVDVAASKYPIFPVNLLMKDRFESIDKINNLEIPKLFIHAKKDMIIPLRFGRKLYDVAPEPKEFIVIEEGGHNDLYDYGAPLHVLEFLRTITGDKAAVQKAQP